MPADERATFLMYHELRLPGRPIVSEEPGYARYVVSRDAFERQMRSLADGGWQGVSVSEWQAGPGPADSVVITFDDGAETDLEAAAPVLETLGQTATFFLTVDFLGRPGFMTRAQARQLAERGQEVGCHSMSHAYLDDLEPGALEREIAGAKRELEDIVGRAVTAFSCPGGRVTPQAVEVARRAGFKSVATSEARRNSRTDSPWSLGRVAILDQTTDAQVLSYAEGRGVARQRLRASVFNAGKRILGNRLYEAVRGRLLGGSDPG